jgi:hypothetical protein
VIASINEPFSDRSTNAFVTASDCNYFFCHV